MSSSVQRYCRYRIILCHKISTLINTASSQPSYILTNSHTSIPFPHFTHVQVNPIHASYRVFKKWVTKGKKMKFLSNKN